MSRTGQRSDDDLREALECACFRLRMASRLVTQLYDEALRPLNLRTTQFTLLAAVGMEGPISIGELAAGLGTDRTTLTRNLRVLEGRDLVRVRAGGDRRSREVELTAEGRQLVDRAFPVWRAAQRAFLERVGGDRVAAFAADVAAALQADKTDE